MTSAEGSHILVVEDDADVRETLCEWLIDAGYLPLSVSDGVEALKHLRSGQRPSLIILDLMLPRIDGWRFLEITSEEAELAAIPVLVCTAADGAHPPGVPGDHVLPKPVDIDTLMSFVIRYCGPPPAWSAAARRKAVRPPAPRRRRKKPDVSPP